MSLSFLGFNGMTVVYILIAILVFLLMILIHELGHYVAGRIFKFKINEFSIGFGKAIFQKTNKRGEKISVRLFPLGGYCAFEGETGEDGSEKNPEAFINQKPWKRIIVLFSGAFFNFLSAIIFSFILLVSFGFDIYQVTSPSYFSDTLKKGDVIYEVDGKNVNFATNGTLSQLLSEKVKAGDFEFDLTVRRYNEETKKNEMITITVTLGQKFANGVNPEDLTEEQLLDTENPEIYAFDSNGNKLYSLGNLSLYPRPFFEALGQSFVLAIMMAWAVLKSLWLLITFQLSVKDVGGPIATIGVIATSAQASIVNLFILLPLIAANLAMFNLLPFPALDGAQIVFTGVEWIRKKPINPKVQGIINFCGLIFLLTLVVVLDILHFVLWLKPHCVAQKELKI